MKIHLAWIRATAAAAIAVVGFDGHVALGQYAPYGAAPQQYSAPQQYGAQQQQPYSAQQPYAAPQQSPQTAAYGTPGYGAPATAYNSQPARPTAYQQPAQQPSYQQPSYAVRPPQYPQQQPAYPQTATRPTNPYLAQNNGAPTAAAAAAPMANESLPTPAPMNGGTVNSGPMMNGSSMDSSSMSGAPAAQGYDMGYQNNGGGCSTCGSGYPTTSGYGSDYGYGSGCGQQQDYGIGNYFDQSCGGRQWFGGVYYLFMDRTNPNDSRLAVSVDTNNFGGNPYYPPKSTTVLETVNANDDFRSGGEIRFGSTFSIGSQCDSCNTGYGGCGGCGSCSTQDYAWEAVWWAIDSDDATATFTDTIPTDSVRMYGMKNFGGLEYDRDGAGANYAYRPVNTYYDYNVPIPVPTNPVDGDVRVLSQYVRTSFSAQNIELNFLRLPMMCGSAPTCNSGGCGGYGDCGGNGGCGCEQPSCGSAFSLTGLCGIRFLRIDDDFAYNTTFDEYLGGTLTGTPNTLYYNASVDDLLTGFQWGTNMNYCIACRWNLFCDSTFGVFDNHMRQDQRVYSNTGVVRFVQSGGNATVSSTKDDVSFLGELRMGGSYDISCHWRAVLAYRAVGITGLALSTDLPTNFADEADVRKIDSGNSVVIHGIQLGVECRY